MRSRRRAPGSRSSSRARRTRSSALPRRSPIETRGLESARPRRHDRERLRLRRLRRASSTRARDRFRLTHAGSFFGKRDPKPFLRALAESGLEDVTVRFLGDFRPADREFMESLGLADRVELIDHVPRRESLRLQRDSDALLLLIPEAGGRGRGVLSGKVFEYLAAERPVLAIVPRGRRGGAAHPRHRRGRRRRRPRTWPRSATRSSRCTRGGATASSTARRSRPSGATSSRARRASRSSPSCWSRSRDRRRRPRSRARSPARASRLPASSRRSSA